MVFLAVYSYVMDLHVWKPGYNYYCPTLVQQLNGASQAALTRVPDAGEL